MVHADGTIDWRALDRLTADSPAARTRLYEVVTPAVRAAADAEAKAVGEDAVLVVDLALLTEAAAAHEFDQVVRVTAPDEARVARLMQERGLSREQAWAEIDADAADLTDASADYDLVNDGEPEDLVARVDEYWAQHVAPALEAASGSKENV